jgi:hypothetical protein
VNRIRRWHTYAPVYWKATVYQRVTIALAIIVLAQAVTIGVIL